MNACKTCGMPGGAWITHVCGIGVQLVASSPQPNRSNTVGAMTAEQWQVAWQHAVTVVVAARRFVDAEADGNPALIEDAHMGLLRALTDYVAAQSAD